MWKTKLDIKNQIAKIKLKKQSEKTLRVLSNSSVIGKFFSFILKSIILLFFGMIVIFPFYYMIATSLMTVEETRDTFNVHLAPAVPVWENFKEALISGYWRAILITASVTAISVCLKIVITMLMGYAFSLKKWRFKKAIWFLFLSLLMIPEVALMLGQYNVMVKANLNNGYQIILALIIPFMASVFSGFMFRNAFEAIPQRTKEAALVDGASGFKYFVKIAVPMVTPTTWTVGILTAFASWNSYVWPSLLLSGSDIKVINIWLFDTGRDRDGIDSRIMINIRMAGAILAILPMFIAYFLMRRKIMNAISKQGKTIKG